MTKEDYEARFEWVRANIDRLQLCPGPHVFVPLDPKKPGRVLACERCHGEIDASHAYWYAVGLEHGRSFGIRSTLPTLREQVGTEADLTGRIGDAR